jgi:hypothetical protein
MYVNIIPGLFTSAGDAGDFGDVNGKDADKDGLLGVWGVIERSNEFVERDELEVDEVSGPGDFEDGDC